MARKIYTSEEVRKRMEALPKTAADFLYSSEMGGIIRDIATKHSLHIDQTGLLEAETGQLILGLTEPQEFVPYITESLKVSAEQAANIAKDVNEQVMSKIRASMGQPSGTGAPVTVPSVPKPAPIASTPIMDISAPSVVMPSSSKLEVPPASAPVAAPAVAPVHSAAPAPTPATAPKPAAIPAPISVVAPTPAPSAAPAPKSAAAALDLGAAEAILSEKKVTPPAPAPASGASAPASATAATSTAPKVDPTQPQPYKADPYREPVE